MSEQIQRITRFYSWDEQETHREVFLDERLLEFFSHGAVEFQPKDVVFKIK